MTTTARWLWLALVALTAAGCGGGGASGDSDGQRAVTYTRVALTAEQGGALTRYAGSQMRDGKIPSDVALIVSPQPADVPAGKLLVALEYGSCGHSLGEARLDATTLVIDKLPPKDPGTICGGIGERTGILVTVPKQTTIREARINPISG